MSYVEWQVKLCNDVTFGSTGNLSRFSFPSLHCFLQEGPALLLMVDNSRGERLKISRAERAHSLLSSSLSIVDMSRLRESTTCDNRHST